MRNDENEAIITKALAIAQANGYFPLWDFRNDVNMGWTMTLRKKVREQRVENGMVGNVTNLLSASDILFDPDFCKAIWGESLIHDVIARNYSRKDKNYILDDMYVPPNNWQFHIQQMAVAANRIAYLGENLDD